MSKISVTTIAGLTSGGDANTVKIESGDDFVVDTNVLKVDATNNRVGIGVASPTRKLELNNGGTGNLVTFTDGVATNFTFKTDGSNVGTFGTEAGSTHLAFMSSGTERMRIDSSGRVTMPSQPVFFATADANIPLSNSYSELTAFSNGQVNVGTHYNTSNGRFTAPVAGTYQFAVASIGNSNADVYRFRPYKNGSSLNNYELRIHTEGGAYGTNGEFCFIVTLAVNDYISIFGYSDGSNNAYGDTSFRYSYFRGHLMG